MERHPASFPSRPSRLVVVRLLRPPLPSVFFPPGRNTTQSIVHGGSLLSSTVAALVPVSRLSWWRYKYGERFGFELVYLWYSPLAGCYKPKGPLLGAGRDLSRVEGQQRQDRREISIRQGSCCAQYIYGDRCCLSWFLERGKDDGVAAVLYRRPGNYWRPHTGKKRKAAAAAAARSSPGHLRISLAGWVLRV